MTRIQKFKIHKVARINGEGWAAKICVALFILVSQLKLSAQHFNAEATLSPVDSNRFYRIPVSPEVTPFINENLNNIRIFDAAGKEVPYLLEEEQPIYTQEQFKEYPILEKKQVKGCCTSLILNNADKRSISNISLIIKNAEVLKHATLLGSDDQKEWYALKEHFVFRSINNSSGTSEVRVVEFPLTNYNYLSLQIDDSASAPLNIVKAGYYDVLTSQGTYTEIRPTRISIKDSASLKKTFVQLNLDTAYLLDKLELTMSGPPYFLRQAQLSQVKSKNTKEGPKKFYAFVSSFEVNSKAGSIVDLPAVKTDALRIVVDNGNNLSLQVASFKVYQLNRYLIAWLKKDEQYKMKFGDDKIGPPDYDLTFFKDSIPDQLPVLKFSNIITIEEVQAEPSPTFFTTKYFIWVAIVVVIAVLGFFSIRLIKDVGKTHENEGS